MKLPLALTAAAAIMLTSCNHKEFCYDHPHGVTLRVVYDWSEAPDANPAGMCVFFYNIDVEMAPKRFDFNNIEGGEIELTPGRYRVMTYNNDTEASLFASISDFDIHYVYTREGNILEPIYGNTMPLPPRSDGTEDERVVITPDMIWGCTEIEVTVTGVTDQVITLYPHDMLCHYSYEVRNVKNLKHVSQMSGAISGMAPAMYIAGETLHTEPVTLPFGAASDGASTIRGEFLTFGHHEEVDKPHRMSFYMVMDDGSKFSFTSASNLDVTDQVHSAPDRRRVHIIIDGLELPTPIENGSGFKPEVDNWQDVKEDIIL